MSSRRSGSRRRRAIADGDTERGLELLDRAVTQWRSLQEYSINWITEPPQLRRRRARRRSRRAGAAARPATISSGRDATRAPSGDRCRRRQRAKVIARAMVANFGAVEVDEDDEKIVLSFRCGSGGQAHRRRSLRGRARVHDAAGTRWTHVQPRRAAGVLRPLLGEQRDPAGRVGSRRRRASSSHPSARGSRASTTSTRT